MALRPPPSAAPHAEALDEAGLLVGPRDRVRLGDPAPTTSTTTRSARWPVSAFGGLAVLHGPVAAGSSAGAGSGDGLGRARGRRWWVSGRRVGSIRRAAAFVDDVGFALLFPASRALAPSLWEAVAGADEEPFAAGMGPSEQKVWAWKDELPRRGLAWYGAFVAGRGSFLSPALLAALYPGLGRVDDHESLTLSSTAHQIADTLAGPPLPSAVLRALIGDRSRYQRAVLELQRHLLITTAGVQENPSGWPSALLDLTCRRFQVGAGTDHQFAATRFLNTMLQATPADLARTFRWPPTQARARRTRFLHHHPFHIPPADRSQHEPHWSAAHQST